MPLIFCSKCDNDLEECTCADLGDKIGWLEALRNHGMWIGPSYLERLGDQAKKNDPDYIKQYE